MAVEKNLTTTTNLNKKQCPPVIKWNKKHLPKEVIPIINTLEKIFFAVHLSMVPNSFLFRQNK